MKRILLGLVALFSLLPLVAQEEHEYTPYVRDCEFGYYGYSENEIGSFTHYWIEGDFKFNSKYYKGFYNDRSGEKKLLGYLREVDQKVYFRDGEKENLMYDFSLKEGDSFTPWDIDKPLNVLKVRDNHIYGKTRKEISLEWGYWIEGVGDDECLPFETFAPVPDCICGNRLFYIKEQGEFIYRKSEHRGYIGDEEYIIPIIDPYLEGTGGIDATQGKTLQVITQGEQWIVTLPGDDYRMVEVIDTTGRVAWCDYIDGNANNITIPAIDLARGIYIVALTAKSGERITAKVAR